MIEHSLTTLQPDTTHDAAREHLSITREGSAMFGVIGAVGVLADDER